MKVWILNHYGGPPGSGRFERPVYMARAFQAAGHDCTVYYSGFHHLLSEPRQLSEVDYTEVDGVKYGALPCREYTGNGVSRVLNMLDFSRCLKASFSGSQDDAPDLIVASSPPPFVFHGARWFQKQYESKVIFEVRDLWPESLIELAGVSACHPFVLWLGHTVKQACRKSDAVVSLLPRTHENLEPKGMAPEKFNWVPNGIDPGVHKEKQSISLPDQHRDVINEIRTRGSFVIGYAGAMGPPNALDQLVTLAEYCEGKQVPYEIVLVGSGVSKQSIQDSVDRLEGDLIHLLPSLQKNEVPSFLKAVDATIIVWNDSPLYRFGVSPNKVSEYMLEKKPVVWVGDTGNDPVKEAGAGFSIEGKNPERLHEVLCELSGLPESEITKLGEAGEKYVSENLNWEILGRKYVELGESLVSG